MISKTTKRNILQQLLAQSGSTTITSNCYLGLLTAEPVDNGSSVTYVEPARTWDNGGALAEPVSTGYERTLLGTYNQSMTYKMTVSSNGTATNSDVIYLCECLEHDDIQDYPVNPWGTCTYFGLFTAKTGGSLFAWGLLLDKNGDPAPITPVKNQIPVIRKNQLDITIE